jgi:hypothetical protein
MWQRKDVEREGEIFTLLIETERPVKGSVLWENTTNTVFTALRKKFLLDSHALTACTNRSHIPAEGLDW